MRFGFKPRLGSFWIGAHWSPYYKRLCINLVPCLTVFIVFPGGKTPEEAKLEGHAHKVKAESWDRIMRDNGIFNG